MHIWAIETKGDNEMSEPWWIKDDRELVTRWERMVAGKADDEKIWALGDSRPETIASLKQRIIDRKARIEADIACNGQSN